MSDSVTKIIQEMLRYGTGDPTLRSLQLKVCDLADRLSALINAGDSPEAKPTPSEHNERGEFEQRFGPRPEIPAETSYVHSMEIIDAQKIWDARLEAWQARAALQPTQPPSVDEAVMTPAVCRAMARFYTKLAQVKAGVELGSQPVDEEGARHADCHGLDTPERVRFYEHDFYVLSNFSAFRVTLDVGNRIEIDFDTSEAAYHYFKFPGDETKAVRLRSIIRRAKSAHEAFKIAEFHKPYRRADWDDVKLDVMRRVLRAKADQHEYVRRKLLATGDRELVEDSWRDDFWGWGPNRDGQNMLGKLWMEIRAELRSIASQGSGEGVSREA